MSRICLAMLSVVTLAACGDSGQLLAPAPSTPRAAAAQTQTVVFDTPYHSEVFLACANGGAGEEVHSFGTIHRVIHVTENANGFHLTLHANPQNVTGTGEITGDTYQARGTFTGQQNNVIPGTTVSIHDTFFLVGPGPDNNLKITTTYHLTINANGEITTESGTDSIECS